MQKFFRLEAENRLEPSLYEAEWAYLPCYNDLNTHPKNIRYTPCEKASGKMVVSFIGGSSENYAEWDNVYSKKGGIYEMKIFYLPEKDRKLEINVNGKLYFFKNLETDNSKRYFDCYTFGKIESWRKYNSHRQFLLLVSRYRLFYIKKTIIHCFMFIETNERITYLCKLQKFSI